MWLSACAAPATPSVHLLEAGQTREQNLSIRSQKLFAETTDGWRVFKVEYKDRSACIAVKPAEGMPWPKLSEVYAVSGGAGFTMYILDHLDIPYFGFYGEYPFGASTAKVNDEVIRYSNDRDTVLGWENLDATFTATTQPGAATEGLLATPLQQRTTPLVDLASGAPASRTAFSYEDGHKASGKINFAGVTKAYEAMMQCHAT